MGDLSKFNYMYCIDQLTTWANYSWNGVRCKIKSLYVLWCTKGIKCMIMNLSLELLEINDYIVGLYSLSQKSVCNMKSHTGSWNYNYFSTEVLRRLTQSGADPGFSFRKGGGPQKIICANAHYEREIRSPFRQGSMQGPGSSRVF